jgi:muramidase (phage lysozyme)
MMLYFHAKRFDPQFSDCLKVPSLSHETTTKGGGRVMTAGELIADWLTQHPEGSITITDESQ